MGAVPYEGGVTFRVWAPNATAVAVHGTFDDWSVDGQPLAAEDGGTWSADVAGAEVDDEYRFVIRNGILRQINQRLAAKLSPVH